MALYILADSDWMKKSMFSKVAELKGTYSSYLEPTRITVWNHESSVRSDSSYIKHFYVINKFTARFLLSLMASSIMDWSFFTWFITHSEVVTMVEV